jgi:hypothetical protein
MISQIDVLIYVVLGGAITFEIINFVLLIKLRKWSLTAGRNLISQVIRALNVKSNALVNPNGEKGEVIKDALQNVANNEALQPMLEAIAANPEEAGKHLNVGSVIQAFMRGDLTKEDLIQFAPMIMSKLNDKKSGESPSHGRW